MVRGREREWKPEDWRDDSVDLLAAELSSNSQQPWGEVMLDMAAHT